MAIMWASLVIVFFFALMSRYFSTSGGMGPTTIQPNKVLAGVVALSLVVVSGLRNSIGDTYLYMHGYEVNDFSLEAVLKGKDIGFNLLQMVLKQITDDPQLLLFITAFVTNVLIVAVLYKYARLFEISMFVYITSGAFIVSMNGLRQYMAAAIIFAATKYLLEGRWKAYLIVVLFASVFHQSALIMIPIYFIVRRKAWTSTTIGLLLGAVLFVMGYNFLWDVLFDVIADTQYGYYEDFQEGGANVIRLLVTIAPIFIAFMGREKLRAIFPGGDIVVNLSLIGAVLMIIATQNWIFARLAIYFNVYQLLLIGWIIKLFREKDQKFVYIVMISLYLFYYFYENVIILDLKYDSDYISWPF
ncbi:EpsG family protein [Paenibacillus sp. GSMTC-2017]|uniref:EpsG family protein n=1 Tax=Paenibacillus sp. GSMTC-2017 TaxID=2794350 RepID=UPI0018D9B22C|nr:EpsG family protein [Paenibacillus sp. GSMTC-2017]MBH5317305.1 EpsG family protein [Paenibacillus sp. GSMTC-2017]